MGAAAAGKGERAGAYIIDVIPAVFVALVFGWIPILGAILVGFILAAYWLLRDVTGASLGKLLLGLRVVRNDGQEAEPGARILRNLPLAAGPALLIIPILGYVIAPIVAFLISLVELILLLSQGERMGDKIAGTSVIRRGAPSSAA